MKCSACGKASSSYEHQSTLEERCRLDDRTFRELTKILDVTATSSAKDEVDGAGNPIVCRDCTKKAIEAAKIKAEERRYSGRR